MNYHTDGRTCWVKTGVTINGLEHIEYLPVMDYKNNSIPLAKVTSTDVNKSIQRSLTKACARHGLGLYIYAGEDLPAGEAEAVKEQMDVAVEEALLAVKEAKTRDELVRLWKELTGLHANQRFIDALNEKQRELNDIAV
jgi:RecB family exonuclease